MPHRLADRLHDTRQRLFVGRSAELGLFAEAVAAAVLPYFVLYVYGPGGIGKTTLLQAFLRHCAQQGVAAWYVDARLLDPLPEALLAALRRTLGLAGDADPMAALADRSARQVLLIDTCEAIAGLDGWLRETFLPQLPDQVLVVLAGRHAPEAAWTTDPGWQALMRVVPLRNLAPPDSRAYLTRRAIPDDYHAACLTLSYGHPLAISLLADVLEQRPDRALSLEASPDLIRVLLQRFLQEVALPVHRAALEVCALVHYTTEDVLAALLEEAEAPAVFAWLRDRSFIEAGRMGLFPHDLAREVLLSDLRWRNPEGYTWLHQRARRYYTERLKQAQGHAARTLLADYTWLHRDSPLLRPFFAQLRTGWQQSTAYFTDALHPDDPPRLAAMVDRHEGPASARWAQHWCTRQPQGVLVFRNPQGQPVGFLLTLALEHLPEADRAADPATEAAWQYLARHAPLRPGETALMARFWMDAEAHQAVSPVQNLISVQRVRQYLGTPGLACSFIACHQPDFWQFIFAFADLHRLPEADFTLDGHRYGVFGHDWRAVPPLAWLDRLAERTGTVVPEPQTSLSEAPLLVLSRADFEAALRQAFRHYDRPSDLRGNPLLRARLVLDRTGPDADEADRIEALRGLLTEAAAALQASPRAEKLYRALYRAYLHPAPSQEMAAERLGLPFSTYRRHLKAGLDQVTELLWQQELSVKG